MRTLILFAIAGALLAQDKPAEPKPEKQGKLTELQQEKLKRVSAQLSEINTRHKSQVLLESAPINAEANSIVTEMCKGIGVPEKNINAAECKVDIKDGTVKWFKPIPPPPPPATPFDPKTEKKTDKK